MLLISRGTKEENAKSINEGNGFGRELKRLAKASHLYPLFQYLITVDWDHSYLRTNCPGTGISSFEISRKRFEN